MLHSAAATTTNHHAGWANMARMAPLLEQELSVLLRGQAVPYTQSDVSPPQGAPTDAVALRTNVCYIIAAVILNDKNEVLLTQEAKPSCRGRWYLPAGRLERRESLVQGLQREVREETGLECEPYTLLRVEESGLRWVRFVFLATVTGGKLKTEAEADEESLQACWWDRVCPLPLRGRDMLGLVGAAVAYARLPRHPHALPSELPCPVVCLRATVVWWPPSIEEGMVYVLGCGDREVDPHLPVTVCGLSQAEASSSIQTAITRLLQKVWPSPPKIHARMLGLLGIQHLAGVGVDGGADGICFNILITISPTKPLAKDGGSTCPAGTPGTDGGCELPVVKEPSFCWHKVEGEDIKKELASRIDAKALIPIN
uniref:8-oxo-dGDP phosphatase NUDT18 n=1 Tax=Petromyzon marinus TaxID=7757 RepID=A0AAJ7TL17_PETMA|nr:8-oxo-dGDP phosphatase NUDT18 [Petromyzon marinus]